MAEGEEKKDQYTERTAATVEESYSIFFGALSRMEKALGLNSRELGALRLPLFNLGNAMVNFGKDAMQLQRQSLAFNQNFKDAVDANAANMAGLPGGLRTSLESVISFQRQGMFEVNKSTLNLANVMSITGQNVAGLVAINKKLATAGTFSNAEIASLNQGLTDNSLAFGVSTDLLIGAMDNLGDSISVLGFTGGAGRTLQGVSDLTAQFPVLGDTIGKLTGQLATGDLSDLAKFGVEGDIGRLLNQGLSGAELRDVFEKINRSVTQFGAGAGDNVAAQRARLQFAGPIGVMAKQIVDGFREFERDPQAQRQAKIFQDFRSAMSALIMPLAVEIGELTTKVANIIVGIARFVNVNNFLGGTMKALTAAVIGLTITSRLRARSEAANMGVFAMLAAGMGKLRMAFTPMGIAISALLFFLPDLIGKVSDSVGILAEAESDKAKAEIARLRSDDTPTRFESLTRLLINSQMAQFETLNAARTGDMTEFTAAVVDAVDRTTDAVDGTAPKPKFRRTT
tara:strand:+ start:173 stop:1711 length:1539 start_codon:yes stop_codon:yes gene_type:complete